MEIQLCTMKLLCILMSNLNTAGTGNLICLWIWRQVGMFYTGASAWQSYYFALTVPMQSHRNKITIPVVKHNGSDCSEWLTILWLPWPTFPASVMIRRLPWEQLAETIIRDELLAVCCDMQFNNSDGSCSLLPSPAPLTSARGELWPGPGMESTTWEKQRWEQAGANRGKRQLQKIKYFIPWSWFVLCHGFLLHKCLNFSSTAPWLAWQWDTS